MVPPDLLSLKIRCAAWPAVYSELLRTLENKCVDATRKDQKSKKQSGGATFGKDLGERRCWPLCPQRPKCTDRIQWPRERPGVPWLGLRTSTAGAMGSIPGGGAKGLQAVWRSQRTVKNPTARASGSPEMLVSLNSRSPHPPASSPLFSHSSPPALTFHLPALDNPLHDQLPL